MGINVTDDNFKAEILDQSGLVLLDVSAEWCSPCKMLKPILDAFETEMKDKLKIAEADLEKSPTIAQSYGIQSIPALLLFKSGELIDKRMGFMQKPALKKWIDSHLQ